MIDEPMPIPIAGPYRSGTGGDPAAMAANLARLEAAAWPVLAAGHVPMIGEWAAPPGASAGAGQDVAAARRRGLPVCRDVAEIPRRVPQEAG
ncbi:hypothetical protein [Actinomadura parmotrematis]|uniref:DUF4406 domain-containing protein n=1 Tax=Actinomadura parmotrematis TaxID=2864039 RepID=A0ABS7FNN0_9ACTN|nr:hypothetical protein [Actinomadura parmotrematis]MBW8481840.1 hypothetical protein [Actinomadura parmotrematis]